MTDETGNTYDLNEIINLLDYLNNYDVSGENYIIKAEHIKSIINTIRNISKYIGTGNGDAEKNYGGSDSGYINPVIVEQNHDVVLKTILFAINDLVKQLQIDNKNVLQIDLSGQYTNLVNKLKSDQIMLNMTNGINATNIPYSTNGDGNYKNIGDKIKEIEKGLNEYISPEKEHEKLIMKNYQTYNSVIVPAKDMWDNSNMAQKMSSLSVDPDYPHSYDMIVKCPCVSDENILSIAKKLAYGNYDLSIRMRNTNNTSNSRPIVAVTIESEGTTVGTWNIYPQKIKDVYCNINIPFEHNGSVNRNDLKKINEVKIQIKMYDIGRNEDYVFFDYVSINPTTTAIYNGFVSLDNNMWELK